LLALLTKLELHVSRTHQRNRIFSRIDTAESNEPAAMYASESNRQDAEGKNIVEYREPTRFRRCTQGDEEVASEE
jgi:hypothetical protein